MSTLAARMALRNALLRGKRRPRNFGSGSPTMFRGDGYEFTELREYVAGDDPRRIDWAATARAGALQTRVVLEDVALTLAAIVDDSPSMQIGRQRPLLEAASEAVAAWYGAALADDCCARITGRGLVAPLAMRGARSALVCLNAPSAQTRVREAYDVALAALPRGCALLVISDFLDEDAYENNVLVDLGRRFDCTALCAADPWRTGLPLGGFVRVRDVENGRTTSLFIGRRERENYLRAVRAREERLAESFRVAGWRFNFFDESEGHHALYRAFAA